EAVEDCKVFQVRRVHARSPHTGRVHPFYRLESSDWVNVVPLTAEGQVVMVRQFRHGARAVTLEIPGGIVDPGESPAEAAARELLEETGYGRGLLEPLGSLNPNPALFGNRVYSFVARGVERVGEVANTEFEETAVQLVPWREVPGLVQAGEVDHALVIAAFHWLALAGERPDGARTP
ncbi:MAG: NUDIX hydrolase, partial [Myxococcota bacterium]